MEWKLFATLAETAGANEVAVEDEPSADGTATVGDALAALLAERPALADEVLVTGADGADGDALDADDLQDHLRLLVDGRDPFREGDGLDEPVDTDAELALFPPVSGG